MENGVFVEDFYLKSNAIVVGCNDDFKGTRDLLHS